METIKRFKKTATLLAIFGFISAIFFCGLTLKIGIQTEIDNSTDFSGNISYLYQEIVSRYFLISICFLLFIAFLLMRNKIFLKLTGLIPLIVITLQILIMVGLKKDVLPNQMWNHLNWLEISYYLDYGFFILTVVLLILYLNLIRLIHRYSNQ